MEDLRVHRSSSRPRHFAKKITENLFSELFGAYNLRWLYSYNGGGVELDPLRKAVLKSYVPDQNALVGEDPSLTQQRTLSATGQEDKKDQGHCHSYHSSLCQCEFCC